MPVMPGPRATEGEGEPTAVLVIRAWRHGAPPVVVARITYTLDARTPEQEEVAATGVAEIGAVVERWLEHVAGAEAGR
jgi:hypothetical protein